MRVQSLVQNFFYKDKGSPKRHEQFGIFHMSQTFFHTDTVPKIGYEIICIKVEESFKYIKVKQNKKESIYCAVKK